MLLFSSQGVRAGSFEELRLAASFTRGGAAQAQAAPTAAAPVFPAASPTAKNIVAEEFGLPALRVNITDNEIKYQDLLPGTSVPFSAALRAAMRNFIEDYTDEESPLSLVIDEVFTEQGENAPLLPYPPLVVEKARTRLAGYLNRGSSELRLLGADEPAEHGETAAKNWIFFLWIPDLSDHGHWAVVGRSGKDPVYNYGFN